jgi:hypothetical protein
MKKLFGIVFVALTSLASVSVSQGGTYELTKLVESRDFWSTYKWGAFEDSELYKSTNWKLRGGASIGDTKTREDYSTPIRLDNIYIEEMNMYVNYETKEVNSFGIYTYNKLNKDDYSKFVSWCNDKFGDVSVENKRTETFSDYVRDTVTSSWPVENTIVRVKIENNLSNGPKSVGFITTLSFARNYRPQVNIVNEIQPKKLDHEMPEAQALSTDLQRNNHHTQAISISRSSEAVPGATAPAVANSRSITSESNAVKPIIGKYLPPPYVWDDELGITHATNDIQDVPENKRAIFETNVQK